MKIFIAIPFLALFSLLFINKSYADSKYPLGAVLLQAGETILGETIIGKTIIYPDGPAKVTAVHVTMQPGQETGWHSHEVPLFAYVLDGELTVDYGA